LREYEFHPESKCADLKGQPCNRQTIGLLQRRHVRIDSITPIGKESNNLEGVEAGVIHSEQEVYTVYTDPERDEWHTKIIPALRDVRLSRLVKMSGMSPSALKEIRAGRSRPHTRNRDLLAAILRELKVI